METKKNILQLVSGVVASKEVTSTNELNLANQGKVEAHKRMYKDAAISAPYASNPMKVPSKLKLAKHTETMEAVCNYTGIVICLEVPRIEGYAFEYQNPLSIYSNVKGMIAQGPQYLHKIDVQVLAGMYITAYRHYDLMEAYNPKAKISAAAMNAMLRTAGKDILVEALDFINLVNSKNCHRLPAMSFDYQAHKEAVNMAPAVKEYTKLLRGILFPESIPSKDKALKATVTEENMRITERNDLGIVERRGTGTIKAYTGVERRKDVISKKEQEFEERFKKNKKRAKDIVATMEEDTLFAPKFLTILRGIVTSRNMVLMDTSLRSKIIAKLEEKPSDLTNEMIAILKASIPEESDDPFADPVPTIAATKEQEQGVEEKMNAPKPMTAAERIAAIKAAIASKSKTVERKEDDNSEF